MTPPRDLHDKDALIAALMARIEALVAGNEALVAENAALAARVAELEVKLGLPPKTPDNSSVPPSKGQKPSGASAPKAKAKPHRGAHRPLHPNPTAKRAVLAATCKGCGADVSGMTQIVCEEYDRVEIPRIAPDVTRVSLHGGVCPCCSKRFKAEPPAGLEPGSPFGPNLRAFVIYLRSVQGLPLARLCTVLADLFGLAISEGALVNILDASRKAFSAQTCLIKARLLAGPTPGSGQAGRPGGHGHGGGWGRARRWPRTRPASGSARRTGGCGCSITPTAPSSSPTSTAPRRWWKPSLAVTARITGSPTAMAARWAGPDASIRSVSRI